MTTNTINLERFIAKDTTDGTPAKVFTGRDRGESVRKASNIDEIEKDSTEINIIIPDTIYSINPSFFEELFLNVVLKYIFPLIRISLIFINYLLFRLEFAIFY